MKKNILKKTVMLIAVILFLTMLPIGKSRAAVADGMCYVNNEWRYRQGGKINYQYTGMASNEYGWWYYQNGRINWNYT